MVRKYFFTALLVAGALTACQESEKKGEETTTAATATPSSAEPADNAANAALTSIQWIDSTLDKGTINEGEKLEIVYRFKNTGEKPLVIKDVKPSCGCTVAEKPGQPIAPGQEGSIKAAFDSHNKPGPNHKTLTVTANTQQETYHLSFNVVVNKKS
ncbi:MAG: DUF1573 domain-containing protein [Chitinophagaceae bacterium]|nr:DUF1573 domain-containing protein [Chitinophagaceae bacterium]